MASGQVGVAKVVDDPLSGINPQGYGIVECTPSTKPRRGRKIPGKMTVKFRATHDVKLVNSAPFTLASFTIGADKPTLQVNATAAQRRSALPIDKNVPLTQDNVRDYILHHAAH